MSKRELPDVYEERKIYFPNFTPRQVNLICEFSRYIDDMHGDGLVDQWSVNMSGVGAKGSVGCHLHEFIHMHVDFGHIPVEYNNDCGFYMLLNELGIDKKPQMTRLLQSCFDRQIEIDDRGWSEAWDSRKWGGNYGDTFFNACSSFAFRAREIHCELDDFVKSQKVKGAAIGDTPEKEGISYA